MNDLDDDSDESSRFDDMLMAILQHKGQIQPFLDTIFKFLYKRLRFVSAFQHLNRTFVAFSLNFKDRFFRRARNK